MRDPDRYVRQLALTEIGVAGQQRLGRSSALIVGCGAVGGHVAQNLARAGVGRLRLVDHDQPERHNLHRQVLFDEHDVATGRSKAEAAAARLRAANSEIAIEARVARFDASTAEALVADVDVVLDGSDNFAARYLLNDVCRKLGKPWIYGGAIATTGMSMTILPDRGPCLRCVFRDPPPADTAPTCVSRGVLITAPAVTAAIEATAAIKLLVGDRDLDPALIAFDLWAGRWQRIEVRPDPHCPTCNGRYEFLAG